MLSFKSFIDPHNNVIDLETIPDAFVDRPNWQQGIGEHACDIRQIFVSTLIKENTDCGTILNVSHLVFSGSSQWVFGRNITTRSDIMQRDDCGVIIPGYGN